MTTYTQTPIANLRANLYRGVRMEHFSIRIEGRHVATAMKLSNGALIEIDPLCCHEADVAALRQQLDRLVPMVYTRTEA